MFIRLDIYRFTSLTYIAVAYPSTLAPEVISMQDGIGAGSN